MAPVSVKRTISRITDKVLIEMHDWVNRPLNEVYAAIFIDAIYIKVREGTVTNRPFSIVLGVTIHGERDILGIWAGDSTGGEGANILVKCAHRGEEPGSRGRLHHYI